MTSTSSRRTLRLAASLLTAVTVAGGLAACGGGSGTDAAAGDGSGKISIWAVQGQDSENAALQAAVKGFNASQSKTTATLRIIPGDTYTSTVNSTPAKKLPDVLEMDGPNLASYVYNGKLAKIKDFVSAKTVDNATPGSISEGTYDGSLYALAQFDSALGVYGNKKMLDAAGITIPTSIDDAWTAEEFTADLAKLAAASPSGKSLDISEASGLAGEWGTYAFAPLVWSAGGGLLKDDKAGGVMDSAASIKALETLASWKPYVDPNADGNAFTGGRVALGWGGHWNYPAYSKALGSDLVDLPLPNLGEGSKTGAGSLTWGIGSSTQNGKAAGSFLDYLLNDENVTAMTSANGSPPATRSVFEANTLYSSGGPLALFGEQLSKTCGTGAISDSCVAVSRPVTPGYPVVTSKFAAAVQAVYNGSDAKSELTKAAEAVDEAYKKNNDYK